MRPPVRLLQRRSGLLTAVLLLASLAPCGCASWPGQGGSSTVQVRAPRAEPAERQTGISRQELRFRLERFADTYTSRMWEPLDAVIESDADFVARKESLEAKYSFGSNAIFIASGPYPAVSLLDMIVSVTLTRIMLEQQAASIVGEAAVPIVAAARDGEEQVWRLAAPVLSQDEQDLLRGFVEDWQERNPDVTYVEDVRFDDFVGELDTADRKRARGLIGDVRAATRAADEALELAGRLTFFFQRAPLLWRMHAQLAYFEIFSQPEIRGVLADSARISSSADRLARSAEQLSSLLLEPPTGDNAVALANLDVAEARLRELLVETRQTIGVANQLAMTVDGLATRFDVPDPDPDAEPLDIAELGSVAGEFSRTAGEFRALVDSMNTLLASPAVAENLPNAVQAAEDETRQLLRYAVILALVVILTSIVSTVVAMLGYRYLSGRIGQRSL